MSEKVLVGYATRTGSTVGVAEAIGSVLSERGFDVDVRPLSEVSGLEDYDAVVLGSAVNGGRWLPDAVAFVESHREALEATSFSAFCVHSMNGGDDPRQTRKRVAYLDPVRALVQPTAEGYFLGQGPDPADTSRVMRWAFRAFGGSGEGDLRDWDKIGAWARQLQCRRGGRAGWPEPCR